MQRLFLALLITLCKINISYGIQLYPSGISINFDAPSQAPKQCYLLQKQEEIEKKSLKTYRIIRAINGIKDIPNDEFLALVFYNAKNKVIGNYKIINSDKPQANQVFFIDRNSGHNFQGILDIYSISKKTSSFALAYVNKKGKILAQPFTHSNFNELGQITLETFLGISPTKNIMLQYEINGTYIKPNIKVGSFHFVR